MQTHTRGVSQHLSDILASDDTRGSTPAKSDRAATCMSECARPLLRYPGRAGNRVKIPPKDFAQGIPDKLYSKIHYEKARPTNAARDYSDIRSNFLIESLLAAFIFVLSLSLSTVCFRVPRCSLTTPPLNLSPFLCTFLLPIRRGDRDQTFLRANLRKEWTLRMQTKYCWRNDTGDNIPML